MFVAFRPAFQIGVLFVLAPCVARGANPVQWNIVEQLTRGQPTKIWTSPTAVDLNKMVWEYDFEITKVTGTVDMGFLPDITQDITDSIPADVRIGSGETRDLPAVLLDDMIAEPETGTSADVLVEINNLGFGRAVFSNIVLGSVTVPIFGSRPIQRINLEAEVNIIGYDFGDYNRSGKVDAADYVLWRDEFGQMGPDLAADGNGDERIDGGDYQVWRTNFGRGGSAAALGAFITSVVPEPSSGMMLLSAAFIAGARRKKRD
jgi:PEP-CTERM motif